jgi:hypothetical protein
MLYHLDNLPTCLPKQEEEVMGRIKASLDDPLGLELAGHALYDMVVDRRGNLFGDEIYRLTKAHDATTNVDIAVASSLTTTSKSNNNKMKKTKTTMVSAQHQLPSNHKFSANDVIMLTLQPLGSGDVFDGRNLPTSGTAISTEARVVSTGPYYVDIAIPAGMMEATFGAGAAVGSNTMGDMSDVRLRVDRFFSDVPYRRMVEAVTRMASVPTRRTMSSKSSGMDDDSYEGGTTNNGKQTKGQQRNRHLTPSIRKQQQRTKDGTPPPSPQQQQPPSPPHANICMDEMLREAVISTYSFSDPSNPLFHDVDSCDLQSLGRVLAKPPMPNSVKLANEVLTHVQANSNNIFRPLNAPQLAAVGAALTRKLTLIQGPPGTGMWSYVIPGAL